MDWFGLVWLCVDLSAVVFIGLTLSSEWHAFNTNSLHPVAYFQSKRGGSPAVLDFSGILSETGAEYGLKFGTGVALQHTPGHFLFCSSFCGCWP